MTPVSLLLVLVLLSVVYSETMSMEEVMAQINSGANLDVNTMQQHIQGWKSTLKAPNYKTKGKLTYSEHQAECRDRLATSTRSCSSRPNLKDLSSCDQLISTQSRLAVFLSNETAPRGIILIEIGDREHQRAIAVSRGLYSNRTFSRFDLEGKLRLASVLGPCFNFLTQPYVPTLFGIGGYVSPCNNVVLLPYTIGVNESKRREEKYTYSVMFDSDHLEQGESDNRWRVVAAGLLAFINGTNETINTPQGVFYSGQTIGYSNYAQVNLDCPRWDANDPDCVINNLILPPSFSVAVAQTPYRAAYPNSQLSFTPLTWENDCCERGTGTIGAYLQGPDFDYTGALRKYQMTTLILPNECN